MKNKDKSPGQPLPRSRHLHSISSISGLRSGLLVFILLGIGLALSNCKETQNHNLKPSESQLVTRGRVVYQTYCTACHHTDPHKAGSIGPDVYGSSKELLEARILNAAYPEGYQPKRKTHTMVALPHLKYEIEAIRAYLNSKSTQN